MNRTTLALISGVAVALLLVTFVPLSQAAGPAGMKLYAFSSGGLTIAKSALQSGAPSTQVTVPVGFFVVKHPKGNFLFDTGNNDKIINDPTYWGPFVKADLHDSQALAAVFAQYRPVAVMHFAALALVGESVEKPELYYRNNVVGTFHLLEAMRQAGVRKIVFSSTTAT